jgi:hypothetical protein
MFPPTGKQILGEPVLRSEIDIENNSDKFPLISSPSNTIKKGLLLGDDDDNDDDNDDDDDLDFTINAKITPMIKLLGSPSNTMKKKLPLGSPSNMMKKGILKHHQQNEMNSSKCSAESFMDIDAPESRSFTCVKDKLSFGNPDLLYPVEAPGIYVYI